MKTALALDLGGTRFRMALVTEHGDILGQSEAPTTSFANPQSMVRESARVASLLLSQAPEEARPKGLAAAVAGAVDQEGGFLHSSPNLPGWREVPLRELLESEIGLPCLLENDANAAAWGEFTQGAGQGYPHLLYVTVSTGIGGGIIIDGHLYRGSIGTAGEIGHTTIEPSGPLCGCGNQGCLETMASGKAIARCAAEAMAKGTPTVLFQLVPTEGGTVTAEHVSQAARMGDAVATEIVRRAATYLGMGLAGMVNVLNPQAVIIGGGVSHMGAMLLEPMEETLRARAFPAATRDLQVLPSALGDDAGLIGAGVLLLAKFG